MKPLRLDVDKESHIFYLKRGKAVKVRFLREFCAFWQTCMPSAAMSG